jgi:hypothetical protein
MSASQRSPEAQNVSYRYQVYGLNVRSRLPLPELHSNERPGEADVDVRLGKVPHSEEWLTLRPDGAILSVPDIASYLMRAGREIVVDPVPHASDRNVRLYLLGSAMGVLLHQRGLLPLHANAIEIDGRAIAVMGESGAGKSTLAAWLHDAGHRIISDDVCVVGVDEQGRSCVHPGLPRIRLWKDALERSGREPGDFEYSFSGDETYEKFDVPVARDMSVGADLELAAIYLLSTGQEFDVTRLPGAEAVEALFSHTYRGFAVSQVGSSQLHFDSSVKVARRTPIFRFERSRDLGAMANDVPRIVEHARRQVGA